MRTCLHPLPILGLVCRLMAAGDDWQTLSGVRWRTLHLEGGSGSGFHRLSPTETGLAFTNVLTDARLAENQIRLNGSGVAMGDVDGDGWCDLYLCGLESDNALFRNLGGWRFTNVTDQAGVACPGQYSTGATLVDLDGDGDLDLLVNGIGVGTRWFSNDGHGRFTEKLNTGLVRGLGATTSALGDFDGDGDLDLYVANYRTTTIRSTGFSLLNVGGKRMIRPQDRDRLELTPEGRILEQGEPDILYLNEGGQRFVPVPWTSGAFLDEDGHPLRSAPRDWGLTVMFRDLNGDRAPDLYVCNDFHTPDRIWINNRQGGFQALDRLALRNTSTFAMCLDIADINRDGYDDIFESDMLDMAHHRRMMQVAATDPSPPPIGQYLDRPQLNRNTVQLNRGDGTFAEVAYYTGLQASGWTWSAIFLDVDLDGYEDLLMSTGHLFDTQDLDAEARIQSLGPFPPDKTPFKILMYPRLLLPNAAFRNGGRLKFEDAAQSWGLDEPGVRQGMAVGDLDNDGDLDVVQNGLNGSPWIFRNDASAPRLGVRLRGLAGNRQGVGARIEVHGGPVPFQSQEMLAGGRYLSSDEAMRVFAAGALTNRLRIEVRWRSGTRSVVDNVVGNRVYEIDEAGARPDPTPQPLSPQPWFMPATLDHRHAEDFYDDFGRQPLLPNRLSQLGPGAGWFDVDADGWEDLFIGAGKGGRFGLYRNNGSGGFNAVTNRAVLRALTRDQTGLAAWRDPAGRTVLLAGSANYEDGDPAGASVRQFDLTGETVVDTLPPGDGSTGPLAMADLDADGTLELIVAGRVRAGRYPEPVSTRLFHWQEGSWRLDVPRSRLLSEIGLVSGMVLTDLDGNGFPDLVLALEWGPLKVYLNDHGNLRDGTAELGLDRWRGWWNGVAAGDFDGDGRMDLVASNWGLNTKHRASPGSPLYLYYADLDGDGTLDLVESHLDRVLGKEVPGRDLTVIGKALPYVREHTATHQQYGLAGIQEIFGEPIKSAKRLEVNTLETALFLNRPGGFEMRPLPWEAQLAPAFAVCVADLDGDGCEDVFLSQNFFATQPQTSRSDAGRGLWLRGDGCGQFRAIPGQESGIRIYGEQRGAALCDYDHDGRIDLVVTQNGAESLLYHNVRAQPGLRVGLEGPTGNPNAIGAQMRLEFEGRAGPAREVRAGSGYWSQDAATQVLGTPAVPVKIRVRWPGGQETSHTIPPGAREMRVSASAGLRVLP